MASHPAVHWKERNTFSIGLLIGFSSWALIFLTLLWGYGVYRLRSSTWLGEYLTSSLVTLAIANTVVLLLSTFLLSKAFQVRQTQGRFFCWTSFVFGIVFLAGQIRLWQMSLANGLRLSESIAGSFFFLLTGFHALHMLGALIALFVLWLKFIPWQDRTVAYGIKRFWDFLLVVWLLMFGLIFIIK